MTGATLPRPRASSALLFLAFWLGPAVLVNPQGDIISDAVLATAVSVVDRGTLEISPRAAIDVAFRDGRLTSGVEPGGWVVALPVYAALRGAIARLPEGLDRRPRPLLAAEPPHALPREVYFLQIALVWLVVAPLHAAAGVLAASWARRAGAGEAQALWTGAAAAFGSLQFVYACGYSRQALANSLILVVLLRRTLDGPERGGALRLLGEGAVVGFAAALNYVGVFLSAAAGLLLLRGLRPRRAAALAAGCALSVAALAAFHHWQYGSVFSTAYHHRYWLTRVFGGVYKGVYYQSDNPVFAPRGQFSYPSAATAGMLLFSPFRGAFVYCPALAAGLLGHLRALRKPGARAFSAAALACFAGYLVFVSCMVNEVVWSGAPVYYGPRQLLSGLALALLGVARLEGRGPVWRAAKALILASTLQALLGAMFHDQMLERTVDDPLLQSPFLPLWLDVFTRGPRLPLLDFYGVSRAVQGAVLCAAAAAAAAALRKASSLARDEARA